LETHILITLAGIGLLGIFCQLVATWVRLPAILFLLLAGIIAGPITGQLNPDELFGNLLFPFVSLAVAVILFEGSLTLKLIEIKNLKSVVRNLITAGALITLVVMALAAHYLADLDFNISLLFGAVVTVTGPTVIIPMLRTVKPNANISNVLRWEGIVIDPLGALLAVIVFNFIISSETAAVYTSAFMSFGKILLVGGITGAIFAVALGITLRRHLVPEYLRNVLTLTLVLGVYAISDLVQHESGLLAVTVMGIVLTNMEDTDIDDILEFKETLSVFLRSGLFIILAARVDFDEFLTVGWSALLVLGVLMFIARPMAVFTSSVGSELTWKEKLMISWIGPRGIVAAAVASIFAIRLEEAGVPGAELLVPMTFMVIIGTVVIQSATAKTVGTILDVREPDATGALIIGAGNVARKIAKALQEQKIKVTLTDTNWESISLARMEGLPTYYGNPVSEHAELHLDLAGIGMLMGMSGRINSDTLASIKFRSEFGANNVYELISTRESTMPDKHRISNRHRGRQLFGEEITYGTMAWWIRNGAEIRTTKLQEEFSFANYLSKHANKAIPLFAINPKSKLYCFAVDKQPEPEPDWSIISLFLPEGIEYQVKPPEPEQLA
jgi:NhaP-type Na+/H+ or K+/H+ antiporter